MQGLITKSQKLHHNEDKSWSTVNCQVVLLSIITVTQEFGLGRVHSTRGKGTCGGQSVEQMVMQIEEFVMNDEREAWERQVAEGIMGISALSLGMGLRALEAEGILVHCFWHLSYSFFASFMCVLVLCHVPLFLVFSFSEIFSIFTEQR